MIKRVTLGEELVITVKNKIGLMAEISEMLANRGINIESALGYESGKTAKLMLVTTANIAILSDLKKKYKSVRETEVVMVELEDKPGAMKVVTTELKQAKIDIAYLYVTAPANLRGSSRMVIQTSDNEKAMALLSKYVTQPE
jgi:hypothetical protein